MSALMDLRNALNKEEAKPSEQQFAPLDLDQTKEIKDQIIYETKNEGSSHDRSSVATEQESSVWHSESQSQRPSTSRASKLERSVDAGNLN